MSELRSVVAAGLLLTGSLSLAACESRPSTSMSAPTECAAPPSTDIHAVEALFEKPTLINHYGRATYYEGMQHIAGEEGVTLPNNKLANEIDDEPYGTPFSVYFGLSRNYLKQFDVSVSVAKPGELSPGATQVPTAGQLNAHNSQYEVREVVDGFRDLPLQYVHFSGLKKIILTSNTMDDAYAITTGRHNTIAVDVTNLDFATDLADHEIYHLVDRQECGSTTAMYNDQAFVALNGKNNIYTYHAFAPHPGEITNSEQNALVGKEVDDSFDNMAAACVDRSEINKEDPLVLANSDYALTNDVEDKAETGKEFAFPTEYATMLDPNRPIVRKKFLLLMARLYEFQPKVVRFFTAVSNRPYLGQDAISQVKC